MNNAEFLEGLIAGLKGKTTWDNPYQDSSDQENNWMSGVIEGGDIRSSIIVEAKQ